jgi:transcriptional regulator with XRE-family HTH domain
MTDDAYGATVAKRRLSRRLTELRKATGHTADHVCDLLDWGRGKVGRIEANHWKRPEMSDIRDLLRVYGVDYAVGDELEELAMRARAKPWWRDYADVFENEFPGFENDATSIRVWTSLLLPDFLQTTDYTTALIRAGSRSPVFRRRQAEALIRRKEILDRTDGTAPHFTALMHEASLLVKWGSDMDRLSQVEHLIEMGERSNVQLRIQRFADGFGSGASAPITIFDLPDGEPVMAFTSFGIMSRNITDEEALNTYIEGFNRAAQWALGPTETLDWLCFLVEQLEPKNSARKWGIGPNRLPRPIGELNSISRSADYTPPPAEAEIVIYLDEYSEDQLEAVQAAAIQLGDELGYTDFILTDEQLSSVFRLFRGKLKTGLTPDFVQQKIRELDERASIEVVGRARAETDAIKTMSAVNVIASLADIPNAVVRVGGLLVIKQTDTNGHPAVVTRELSTREIKALELNPGIQRDPRAALQLLAAAVAQLKEDERNLDDSSADH